MSNNTVDLDEAMLGYYEDYIVSLDRRLRDADIVEAQETGVDLYELAEVYVSRYSGDNGFMKSLKRWQAKGRDLTQAQARAAINFQRDQGLLFTEEGEREEPLKEADEHQFECFICTKVFPTYDALKDHKVAEHDAEERPGVLTEDPSVSFKAEGVAVIENTESTQGLDLARVPDACYAVPNLSHVTKDDYVYIMVKRARRTVRRDRRYTYGKIITGDELVVQGTIEVKLWSSDSKELVGEQKPGDVYRGKLEKELGLILTNPEPFAHLFGRLLERCCICRKALTDDISRQIGMGLECEKKSTYWTETPKSYLPECPTCETKVLGKVKGFDWYEKSTKFGCPHGHLWRADKKGEVTVLN